MKFKKLLILFLLNNLIGTLYYLIIAFIVNSFDIMSNTNAFGRAVIILIYLIMSVIYSINYVIKKGLIR